MQPRARRWIGVAATSLLVVTAVFFLDDWGPDVESRFYELLWLVVLTPGLFLDVMLSGNIHGGFGDARDYVIVIGGSWLAWTAVIGGLADLVVRAARKRRLPATTHIRGFNDLIRRAQGGDRQAMDSVFTQLYPYMEKLCPPHADPNLLSPSCPDRIQEVCLRAWMHLNEFAAGKDDKETYDRFQAWLARISRDMGGDPEGIPVR